MARKDWKGGKASVFKTIGASNHADKERQSEDYYATEPKATEWLCKLEKFSNPILEPACGEGHISKVLQAHGYNVVSRDLINRGYGEVADFLSPDNVEWNGDIITNPPYAYAQEFVEKALSIIPEGNKVAMFLKLTFLEGKKRRILYSTTPPHECGSVAVDFCALLMENLIKSKDLQQLTPGSYGLKVTPAQHK